MQYRSSWMTEELDTFRDQFRKYLVKDPAPHAEKWRERKMVDRFAWRELGEMGALPASVPGEYGGLGATFAYDAAVLQAIETAVPEFTAGVSVHSAMRQQGAEDRCSEGARSFQVLSKAMKRYEELRNRDNP